jgi:uncharacterized protein (DUF2141 family)
MKKVRLHIVKNLFSALSAFLLLLLSNCANEIAPTGGTKDTTPPKLIASFPKNETRNFNAKKIVLKFDEFLNYSLNVAQIQVTPEMKPAAKFYVEGKKIIVNLPKKLDSNVTYNLMFGNTIKDINEGNPIQDFGFCFSTGDSLDVCFLSGTSISLNDMKPAEKIMVGLYSENTDYNKPVYFTNTDKSGAFVLRNIKQGNYFVAAFEDRNLNRIFDKGDGISGFLDSVVFLRDTIRNLKLNLFPSTKGKIVQSIVPRGNRIDIAFTHPIEKVSVTANPKNETEFAYLNETRDSLFYWYSNTCLDSFELGLVINDSTTLLKLKNNSGKDSLSLKKEKGVIRIAPSGTISISASNPIENINVDKVIISEDSIKIVPREKTIIRKESNMGQFSFPKKSGSTYSITLKDSCIKDIFGNYSKQEVFTYTCPKEMETGNLILKLSETDSSYIIIEVRNDKDITVSKKYLSPQQKQIKIDGLSAGNYSVIGTFDTNKNGYWDSGNFELKIQPEKKVLLKSLVVIKSGWDIEADVNMKVSVESTNLKKEQINGFK